jgi:uncharacterized protein Yka (UPF0111/DUF47 family)
VADVSTRHWFLPESPDLLGMLREQTAITVEGMQALVEWSTGAESAADTVRACEHRADEAKRTLWAALREAFSPPFDAEDLFTLSADLDEVLNAAKDLVREMEVMDLAPDTSTHDMVVLLAEAVGHLADAFAHLGGDGHGDGGATEAADAAIKSQRHVERIYRAAMSALLAVSDVHEVIARRELYRRLSRLGDLVHRVAERVWYAVVKEA